MFKSHISTKLIFILCNLVVISASAADSCKTIFVTTSLQMAASRSETSGIDPRLKVMYVRNDGANIPDIPEIKVLQKTPGGLWEPATRRAKQFHELYLAYSHFLGRFKLKGLKLALSENSVIEESAFFPEGDGYFPTSSINLGLAENPSDETIDAVFGHELGHVIIEQYFQFFYKGRSMTPAEVRNRIKVAINERTRLMWNSSYVVEQRTKAEEAGDAAGAAGYTQQLNANIEGIKKIEQAAGDDIRTSNIRGPYDELLGDLLAAIHSGNAGAVADSMGVPKAAPFYVSVDNRDLPPSLRTANPEGPRPRDFASPINFRNWKVEENGFNSYTLLDPVRGALWKKYASKVDHTRVDVFIATYLEAEATHMLQRLDRGEDGFTNANPTQLNQEFFRIFTTIARRNQLIPQ